MNRFKKHALSTSKKQRLEKEIAAFLTGEVEGLSFAYIFGSFATPGPFSDIDIAIYLEKPVDDPLDAEFDLENALEERIRLPVDVRILNKAPVSFCRNVIKEGTVIIDNDPNRRADFQGLVLKKYFDFEPFRRRYLREVINAPI